MAEQKTNKIDAREAVQRAAKYYQDVANDYSQVSVAEVELSGEGDFWFITLMHRLQAGPFSVISDNWGYKVFKIDAYSGEVVSMKVKKV